MSNGVTSTLPESYEDPSCQEKIYNINEMISLQKRRVLLIEDDRTTRRLVHGAIGNHCRLSEAENAGTGISKYIHFDPDIVFLDLNLPDGNGHHILNWIMKNDPGAYVVIFTGSHERQDIKRAMSNGARGYVKKPFDPSMMMYHICRSPLTY